MISWSRRMSIGWACDVAISISGRYVLLSLNVWLPRGYFYGNVAGRPSTRENHPMQAKHLIHALVATTLTAGMTPGAMAASKAAAPAAAAPASAYSQPPKEILDVMRAPPPPSPSLSPTR